MYLRICIWVRIHTDSYTCIYVNVSMRLYFRKYTWINTRIFLFGKNAVHQCLQIGLWCKKTSECLVGVLQCIAVCCSVLQRVAV